MKRILARLDTKNNKLIKSIRYEGLKVFGEINDYALKYYSQGADEIIYIDTIASLYERNSLIEAINFATENIFIPFTIGGGIKSVDQVRGILRSGADKIAINSEAIRNPNIIKDISKIFGSQCVMISIQAKKRRSGKWEPFFLNGREPSGLDVLEWAKTVEKLGAGEILVTSVDQDGTENGFDYELLRDISKNLKIPVIGAGGAKNIGNIVDIYKKTNVSALAVGSILHKNFVTIQEIKKEINLSLK